MPTIKEPLTAIEVSRLTQPGKYAVGKVSGLRLIVKSSAARSWQLRANIGGQRREIGLGGYPEVSLQHARDKAQKHKAAIRDGIDPLAGRRAAKAALAAELASRVTFTDVARQYELKRQHEFKATSRAKQIERLHGHIDHYMLPTLGRLQVTDITTSHVLAVLNPIWHTKTDTATRVRRTLASIFDLAKAQKLLIENPAAWEGNLKLQLAAPSKISKTKHLEAMPWEEMPAFMAELAAKSGVGARALEFTILTAARSIETRLLVWSELDLDGALWSIPAERMKAGRAHVVPLPAAAVALLRAMPRHTDCDLVFATKPGKSPSVNLMTSVLRKRFPATNCTAHGFRSSFKEWARRQPGFSDELSELALAHVGSDATRLAYARDSLVNERRTLMEVWAGYCSLEKEKAERRLKLVKA